jgi:hypothetical protein
VIAAVSAELNLDQQSFGPASGQSDKLREKSWKSEISQYMAPIATSLDEPEEDGR